ncbi:MAG: T9SS type A sorting domain-containing protein [Ignavibacteria bacterium]|nr:T9SS type A sorting domain-containing protein [Ignavibacteria bacterium]
MNWTINKGLSANYITSIYFSDSINGTMTGIFGTILRTTNGGISYIGNEAHLVPDNFQLYQNYPNPFNPSTTIRFSLKRSAEIKILLSNILGEQVRVLTDKFTTAGDHEVTLNSADLSTGVYFCSLIANGSVSQTIKLLLIK